MQFGENSPRAQESEASCPGCRQSWTKDRVQVLGTGYVSWEQGMETFLQKAASRNPLLASVCLCYSNLNLGLLASEAAREALALKRGCFVQSRFKLAWYWAPSSPSDSSGIWKGSTTSYVKACAVRGGPISCQALLQRALPCHRQQIISCSKHDIGIADKYIAWAVLDAAFPPLEANIDPYRWLVKGSITQRVGARGTWRFIWIPGRFSTALCLLDSRFCYLPA